MIQKPNEMKFDNKKLFILIAGQAGIGKTTLALSAPKPLLIDLDDGVSRVNPAHRTDTDVVRSFAELEADLKTADLTPYETIVIDTGGKLLEWLKPVVIAEDPKNGRRDGELSLQGYGAVKRKFSQFVHKIRDLNKHLVMVFHAQEVALDGDLTGLRIRCEGRAKDEVWDDVDIGGFIEYRNGKRTIGFSNCDRYYAKGTYGIHGIYEIPELEKGAKNEFLTKLIGSVLKELNSESEEVGRYRAVIEECQPAIDSAEDAEGLNEAYALVKRAKHVLTSKSELKASLLEKSKALGLKFDKASDSFVAVETEKED